LNSAVQQEAQPVVVEVPEAVSHTLDLLHEQVHRLGGAVGQRRGVPGEHLGLPAADGAGQSSELSNLGVAAVVVEPPQAIVCVDHVGGGVDLTQQLLGQVGGGHLAGGVASLEQHQHVLEGPRTETVMGGQQSPADPIERVGFVTTMVEGGLLGAATHLVEGLVGQAHGMKVINDQAGGG